jgi:ADP-ribosylglycohydrolase
VKEVMAWSESAQSWQEVWEKVEERYGKYHGVHTLPNLAYVLIALLWGEKDFRKTVSIAVMCGKDTDCNGATAGSILGAMCGKENIPRHMLLPLGGRVKSALSGCEEVEISALVETTLRVIESKKKQGGGNGSEKKS